MTPTGPTTTASTRTSCYSSVSLTNAEFDAIHGRPVQHSISGPFVLVPKDYSHEYERCCLPASSAATICLCRPSTRVSIPTADTPRTNTHHITAAPLQTTANPRPIRLYTPSALTPAATASTSPLRRYNKAKYTTAQK